MSGIKCYLCVDKGLTYLLQQINSISYSQQVSPKIIHHIYGRLASFRFENPQSPFDDYGDSILVPEGHNPAYWKKTFFEKFSQESKVVFVGENHEIDPAIKYKLKSSDQIFFLGFGYHRANMEILGLNLKQKIPNKVIVGTGFGLSSDLTQSILNDYPAISRIETCDAYTFLKTKFDISAPERNRLRISG